MLEKIVEEAEKSLHFLEFCMHACVSLPLIWQQKEPKFQDEDEDWNGDLSSSSRSSGRKKRLTDLVADCDEYRCVARGTSPYDDAHIYPHFLLANRHSNVTKTLPPFWEMFKYFWTSDRIKSWQ